MHGNFVVVAVPIRPIPRCAIYALGQLWRKRDGVDPHFKGSRCSPDQRHAKRVDRFTRFVRVPGAHHNDVFESRALLDAIADFAREVTHG